MKTWIGIIIVAVLILGGTYWLMVANKKQMVDYCASKGATAVRTAPNTYNCYTDDGRLVP